VLLVALWYADRQRYAFVLAIRDGKIDVRRGNATAAFVEEVRRISKNAQGVGAAAFSLR
jgi:hypothetical protein